MQTDNYIHKLYIKTALFQFMDSNKHRNIANTHLYFDWGTIYTRKSIRFYNGKLRNCIDFATIDVIPEMQNKGILKQTIEAFEEVATHYKICVYVESILNPIVEKAFKSRFYVPVFPQDDTTLLKCFD